MDMAGRPGAVTERRFYSGMAIFMIVMVLIGFAPSFYLRGLVHSPRPNPSLSPLVLLHGIMFSGWMLIFLMQARLIAGGRRDLHMRLGRLSMVFAASLIPLMIATTIGQVARANQPPGFTPLGWTAVPAFGIPMFAALIWLGWSRRRDAQAHKRLMLCAALMMMDPAIGRIPLFPPDMFSFRLSDLLGWLPFLALIAWDWRTLRRLHWATLFGAGGWGLILIVRGFAVTSPWWERVAGSVVSFEGGSLPEQSWLIVAWLFIAVKLLSTGIGLRLKRSGALFETGFGWAIYGLSKISPAIFCFALYKNAQLAHDALDVSTFGWLTIAAIALAVVVVARTMWTLAANMAD